MVGPQDELLAKDGAERRLGPGEIVEIGALLDHLPNACVDEDVESELIFLGHGIVPMIRSRYRDSNRNDVIIW